jgi:hypothetical protein
MSMHRLCATLLALALSAAVPGLAQSGSVEGSAVSADDSTTIAHALVRLRGATGGTSAVRMEAITSATGRFRFGGLPAGDYRVQLLRIGFRPVTSEVLHVLAGEPLRFTLRAPTQAVQLAAMIVRPNDACLSGAELASDPRLSDLWGEARTGVDTRRAFDLAYQYRRVLRQEVEIAWRLLPNAHRVRADTVINDPDSVLVRDTRRQAINREKGYAEGNLLTLPDEKEIFGDAFLDTHCVVAKVVEQNGAYGLSFRPLTVRTAGSDIRGTVWVDAKTFQVRRLEVEYLRGGREHANAWAEYADIPVSGREFRLPARGEGVLRPPTLQAVLVSRAFGRFTFTYSEFRAKR